MGLGLAPPPGSFVHFREVSVALGWRLGSAQRGVSLSFASPKESKQRKGAPRGGAGFAGSLRYSKPAGAAELGATPLRQSSPSFRRFLRCSAPLMGTPKTSRNDGSAQEKSKSMLFSGRPLETAKNHLHRFGGDAFRVPLRGAEQRRLAGGFGLRLSEPQASLASRPASRVAQGTRVAGADPGVAFSLATFFWRSKRKYARPQGGNITPNEDNISRKQDQSKYRPQD